VAVILLEGGLTLNVQQYQAASGVIRRILTVGVATTWMVTSLAIWAIVGLDLAQSVLAASMVIVTGPTVIAPLLKRIRVIPRLHTILHWEGVLIDPIGVFIAVLWFEWISGGQHQAVITQSVLRVLYGLGIGIAGGLAIVQAVKGQLAPEHMINVFTLAGAILVFGLAELFASESGLLAVTVAGFVVGLKQPAELKQIQQFKSELTELAIGMLFVLLAARLEFSQFAQFGLAGVASVAVVMFVVRPLNVLVSSAGFDLSWREKAFLSWMAPRGIVAASMASLFAIRLEQQGVGNARFIETFTYSVIVATVLLQGLTAGPLARWLGVNAPPATGWLIVGAHAFGRRVARFIRESAGLHAVLADTNTRLIFAAREEGLPALAVDARDTAELPERYDLQGVGNLLALTDNQDLNQLLCQRWASILGRTHVYRWSPTPQDEEIKHSTGRPVWARLPKPSLVSAELSRGESRLRTVTDSARSDGALALVHNHDLILDPQPPENPSRIEQVPSALYLTREADYLIRSIHPSLVARLEAWTLEELITQLVDRIVHLVPEVPREDTIRELLEREKVFPTALGHGVVVPHTYCRKLKNRLCAVAQVRGGLEISPGGAPVELVFLLVSPPGDPEGHLATMAEIARMMLHQQTRERLKQAEDESELLDIIRRYDPDIASPSRG
jgi:NhaP-type Na+/H+ or K+/H+ antiporter/mannitol/fructose-specific phosphotransferase system IIA component (Ntr-type)